jgi:histidinol-phosphate/aromatic aminotransferase/cobyric acid decarboxylase-like protein
MLEGTMSAVVHGGLRADELAALGIDPVDVLDLSANLHPFGPHPHVLLTAREADLRHYPEAHAESLRTEIASRAGLDASQVLVTAGATDAIHLAARALLRPGDSCALWPPTFGEYTAAITAAGATAVEYRSEPPEFAPRLDVAAAPLAMPLAILCNPNNPTGVYLERAQVEALHARLGGTLLLDVAYDPFVEDAWDADDLVRAGTDMLVVHSMTKLHAVPGVRIGYVTGAAERIAQLAALQPSWTVSATALAAGPAMLSVERWQRDALPAISAVRAQLATSLATSAVEVVAGRANFLLARVGAAPAFRLALLRRGFAVRDCTSFGLPEWVRIAVPAEGAVRRLLAAWHAAYEETRG